MSRGHVGDNLLGNWVTDCYRERTGTQVAFQNGGGLRMDIMQGPVTPRTMFNVMPFLNTIVTLQMKGSSVRRVLDQGVAQARMLQMSGVSAEYRYKAPAGQRIVSASVGGVPLDDENLYSVTALDFMMEGGDGYNAFAHFASSASTGLLPRDVLSDCTRGQGVIVAPAAGRWISRED
jgi:2',3'-cyclic-nucleotide 2'-phosphodiesterase/3'-nucleotidase